MLEINVQLFGGRGAKSSLSGIPKNKRKSIESYQKRINEHKEKIKHSTDLGLIHHWQKEIDSWEKSVDKIMDRRDRKRGKK